MEEINSKRTPIYRDAGFDLKDSKNTKEIFSDELDHKRDPGKYIYSRYRNPTVVSAEQKVMELEEADWALLTQSGMSAIETALSIFQKGKNTGKWLFFSEIYGGTNSFIDHVLIERRGLDIRRFYPTQGAYNLVELENLLDEIKPELLYFEIVSNPMLMVSDAEEIIHMARKRNVKVIIDNTFSTPYLYKPLKVGADIVIHSATKYLSGHGNITAGVICGNDKNLLKLAIEYRKLVGHMLSPDDAYRLESQVRSFKLRFKRQCDNAGNLAEKLYNHPAVEKTMYPGLKSHETYEVAKKLFANSAFGGMITFELAGSDDVEKGKRRDLFIKSVSRNIQLIPSLGDLETILLPVEPVWGEKYPLPGMIRLSVGIEELTHLEEVVLSALDKLD